MTAASDIVRLRELCEQLVQRAEADPTNAPAWADTVASLLNEAPGQKAIGRRRGRRARPELDPFEIYRQDPDTLANRLAGLNLEELRDIVAHYGMDPRRLVMKWKTSDRVVNHIVETVQARTRKGDAFRAPDTGLRQEISHRWKTETEVRHRVADALDEAGWRVETEPRLGRARPDVLAIDRRGRHYVFEIKVGRAASHSGALAEAAQYADIARELGHLDQVTPVLVVIDADVRKLERAARELGVGLVSVATADVGESLQDLPANLERL